MTIAFSAFVGIRVRYCTLENIKYDYCLFGIVRISYQKNVFKGKAV